MVNFQYINIMPTPEPPVENLNLRSNPVVVANQKIKVIGMAGPHNSEVGVERVLENLKTLHKVDVLIGLHEKDSFDEAAKKQKIEYVWIPVPDLWGSTGVIPLSATIYDSIYERVKEATLQGKQVAIHCGTGNGRTGTAIAALKLRELIESEAQKNLAFLYEKAPKNVEVKPSDECSVRRCTPFVKQAIELIRDQAESTNNTNGKLSVETSNDIQTLIEYETLIKTQLFNDPNIKEAAAKEAGTNPLYIAVWNGDLESVKALLDPNQKLKSNGDSPLHLAVKKGHLEIVQALLDNHADPNQKEELYGESPLHVAVCERNLKIVQVLLAKNADLNQKRKSDGASPLDIAKQRNYAVIVEVLNTAKAAAEKAAAENATAENVTTEKDVYNLSQNKHSFLVSDTEHRKPGDKMEEQVKKSEPKVS